MAFGRKSDSGGGAPRGIAGEASISIIGPGMTVVGDLVTEGTVRIEGRIQGTVRASKAVVVHKDGSVDGDIVTQDAVIGGRVRGTVSAESRLELQATCDIEGQIRAPVQHLQLEEGARFNGQIQMVEQGQPVRALPPMAAAEPAEL